MGKLIVIEGSCDGVGKSLQYKLLVDIPEYLQSQLPKAEDIEMHIKDIDEIEKQEANE